MGNFDQVVALNVKPEDTLSQFIWRMNLCTNFQGNLFNARREIHAHGGTGVKSGDQQRRDVFLLLKLTTKSPKPSAIILWVARMPVLHVGSYWIKPANQQKS